MRIKTGLCIWSLHKQQMHGYLPKPNNSFPYQCSGDIDLFFYDSGINAR